MAIEQSKGPGADARAHAAKAAATAVRSQAASQEKKPVTGFAAVLATADAAADPTESDPGLSPGRSIQAADASRAPKTERGKPTPGAQPADPDTSDASQNASGPSARKPVGQGDAAKDDASAPCSADAAASETATPLAMQLPVPVSGMTEAAQLPAPAEAPVGTALPPVGTGMAGHGAQRTSQLQQNLAAGPEKNAGAALFSGAGTRIATVDGATENAAVAAVTQACAQDARPLVPGKLQGGDGVLESGAKMMSLLASVASQAEHGAGAGAERRGQEEGRGTASPVPDAWHAAPTDVAGSASTGFSMEDAPVQETVRYWVGADTRQQAQLTVADVAGGAVDVTIHLHGKEAQVSFRADEQQARDALQASSNQLKSLLGQEGLTLSGVSVGTSSAGQDGRPEQRPGSGTAKTGKVTVVGAEATHSPARGSAQGVGGRGGTLDLFV